MRKKRYLIVGIVIFFIILVFSSLFFFIYDKKLSEKYNLSEAECYAINPNETILYDDYSTNARNDCFYYIARERKNVLLCEEIKDFNAYNRCLRSVAEEAQNVDICDKITLKSSDWRENCITAIAISKNDSSLCNKITTYQFNDCLKRVAGVYLCREGICYG